jgi:hypothetical protein
MRKSACAALALRGRSSWGGRRGGLFSKPIEPEAQGGGLTGSDHEHFPLGVDALPIRSWRSYSPSAGVVTGVCHAAFQPLSPLDPFRADGV